MKKQAVMGSLISHLRGYGSSGKKQHDPSAKWSRASYTTANLMAITQTRYILAVVFPLLKYLSKSTNSHFGHENWPCQLVFAVL
jgi:hypothetical protein